MLKPAPPPWRSMARTSLEVSSSGQRAIDLLKSTQKVPADSTPRRSLIGQPDLRTDSVIVVSTAISRVGFKPCFSSAAW